MTKKTGICSFCLRRKEVFKTEKEKNKKAICEACLNEIKKRRTKTGVCIFKSDSCVPYGALTFENKIICEEHLTKADRFFSRKAVRPIKDNNQLTINF